MDAKDLGWDGEKLLTKVLSGVNYSTEIVNGTIPVEHSVLEDNSEISATRNPYPETTEMIAIGGVYLPIDNLTRMHIIARGGYAEAIREYANLGADLNARDFLNSRTPAHYAAMGNHAQVIEVLNTLGTNLNAFDRNGCTPAHYAAESGHIETIRKLSELGVSLNQSDYSGLRPRDYAVSGHHNEVIQVIDDNSRLGFADRVESREGHRTR